MKALGLVAALLAATVLIPASPARAEVQVQAQPAPHLRVMPLGDSITHGIGSDPEFGYRNRLWNLVQQQGRYTVDFVGSANTGAGMADTDHEGHSGWTITRLRARIDGWMDQAQPDVVLLHAGINDLNQDGISGATTASRMGDLVDRILLNRPGVTIVLSGLIPNVSGLTDKITIANAGYGQIAATRAAEGHKVRFTTMPVTTTQMDDRLHPNNSGYVTMADTYFAALSGVVADGWAHRPYDSFTGDARSDLVVHTGTDLTVRESVATGGFDAGTSVSSGWGRFHGLDVPDGMGRLYYADFNGDGFTDLIVHNGTDLDVRLNKRNGFFDSGRTVSSGWGRYHGLHVPGGLGRLYFADFDGDGRADLIVHDGTDINVWINNGAGFDSGRNVTTGYGRYHGLQIADGLGRLYFADYNGDGRDDLVIHDGTNVNVRPTAAGGGFEAIRTVTMGYGRYHGLQIPEGLGRLHFA